MSELIVPHRGTMIEGVLLPKGATQAGNIVGKAMSRIVQILPNSADARAFAVATVVEMNRVDSACDEMSVINAACNCAALGLIPGPARGHAFFVPKWSKRLGTNECQLWTGYKGFLHLAYQTGFLRDIEADVVFEGEPVEFWRDDDGQHIKHDINSRLDHGETGRKVRCAYTTWHTTQGGRGMFVVPGQELYALKQKQGTNSKGQKVHTVYDSDEVGMFRKTPIRRASKLWHLIGQHGHRLDYAVRLEEQAERDEPQDREYLIDVQPERKQIAGLLDDIDDEPADDEPERSESWCSIKAAIDSTDDRDKEAVAAIHQDIAAADDDGSLLPGEADDLRSMMTGWRAHT